MKQSVGRKLICCCCWSSSFTACRTAMAKPTIVSFRFVKRVATSSDKVNLRTTRNCETEWIFLLQIQLPYLHPADHYSRLSFHSWLRRFACCAAAANLASSVVRGACFALLKRKKTKGRIKNFIFLHLKKTTKVEYKWGAFRPSLKCTCTLFLSWI